MSQLRTFRVQLNLARTNEASYMCQAVNATTALNCTLDSIDSLRGKFYAGRYIKKKYQYSAFVTELKPTGYDNNGNILYEKIKDTNFSLVPYSQM